MSEWLSQYPTAPANAIAIVHILAQIWLVGGLLLAVLVPRLRLIHCATLAVTIFTRFLYQDCPLTVWQVAAERAAYQNRAFREGFHIEVPVDWFGVRLDGDETSLAIWAIFLCSLLLVINHRRSRRYTSG